jgi:hypothetical protein
MRGPTVRPPRQSNGHSLPLVLGTRLSPLLEGLGPPPARPSPGPGGSCPRRTNSARTTSRPVTRTNRRTGDTPPTPHHVLGRGGRSCPLEPHPSPMRPDHTGYSGDSDTITKERRSKHTRPGYPVITSVPITSGPPGRAGPAQCYQLPTATKGPKPATPHPAPRAGTLEPKTSPPKQSVSHKHASTRQAQPDKALEVN